MCTLRGLGPGAAPDMDELRKRVKRLVDICPAFESLANKREATAKAAEQAGDKVLARDNYFMAANYWASAMWTIDEVNQKLKTLNDKKRAAFDKYIALADHRIEWVELPYRGKSLPAIFHLPPNYQSGTKVPVIVVVSGMDGYKERSVSLYKDSWMERGYAVLAFEGSWLLGASHCAASMSTCRAGRNPARSSLIGLPSGRKSTPARSA